MISRRAVLLSPFLLWTARLCATPECSDEPTPSAIQGPYFRPSSPKRTVLREASTKGAPLLIAGRVLTTKCKPVANALLDFWSCDGEGVYDVDGPGLRGHQYTNEKGEYRLETVKPAPYRDAGIQRAPHVHVRVGGRETRLLTTQIFFPGEPLNERDRFFEEALQVQLKDGVARFDFVLRA